MQRIAPQDYFMQTSNNWIPLILAFALIVQSVTAVLIVYLLRK